MRQDIVLLKGAAPPGAGSICLSVAAMGPALNAATKNARGYTSLPQPARVVNWVSGSEILRGRGFGAMGCGMQGFIYFNITDHARLPARFHGATRNVLTQL